MKQKILNNWVLKILSIVVAVLVWMAITNTNDPVQTKVISGIPIQLTHEEVLTNQDKMYEMNTSSYASITISGRRSIISNLEAEDFTATAPLTELSIVNAVPVYVTLNNTNLRSEVSITKRTENIRLDIEDIISKEYTVSVQYKGEVDESYVIEGTKLAGEKVTVKAPTSIHDSISKVVITVDVEGAKENITDKYALELYTSSDRKITQREHVEFSVSKLKATTTILKKKLVDLEFSVAGEPADGYKYTDIQKERKQITLVGKENLIDSITKLVIPASVLNIEGRSENLETTVNMENYIPAGTKIGSEAEKQVKVTVFIVEETVLTFKMNPETDIKMSNIPEGYAAKITDTSEMTVLIRGLDIAVGEIDEISALNPTVDLTNAKKGENELPVHFTLPEGVEQIGTVKVKVKLVEEQEDTKETE